MLILIHVLIAITSLIYTTLTYIHPSKTKLSISYLFVGLTLSSGFYLVLTKPAHMLETCTLGLIYLGLVLVGIISARHKLATATLDRMS